MSKVQMIAGISGTRDGADWPPVGGILECSDSEGIELIRAGLARPYVKPSKVETAVAPSGKVEKAVGLSKATGV